MSKKSPMFLPPPYTWAQNVDLTGKAAFWRPPKDVVCCELRLGDTEGQVRIEMPDTTFSWYGNTYDIVQVIVTGINRVRTTKALRNQKITALGYKEGTLVDQDYSEV